jgi:hypothetical protein
MWESQLKKWSIIIRYQQRETGGDIQGKRLGKNLVETLLGNYSYLSVRGARTDPLGSQNKPLQCVLRLAQRVLRVAQGVLTFRD